MMHCSGTVFLLAVSALALTAAGCRDAAAPAPAPAANAPIDAGADVSAGDESGKPAVTEVVPHPAPKVKLDETKPDGADSKQTGTDAPQPDEAKSAQPQPNAQSNGRVLLGSPELTAGLPGQGALKLDEIKSWLADARNHQPLEVELPLGLAAGASQIVGLDKNPLTRAKIELGRQLYFDGRLSADGKVACASCHHPAEGYARHTQFGVGIEGQTGGRNSPVSFNRLLSGAQFWDGRAESLEAQAVGPIQNPIEMGNTHEKCVETLKQIPGYAVQFEKVFGGLAIEHVGQAIASFERSIVTSPSAYDYFDLIERLERDPDALEENAELQTRYEAAKKGAAGKPMSDAARRGRDLFFGQKANCTACHVGANFSDEKYHNLGVGMDQPEPDLGREAVTKDAKDRGAFKTPTVRNVALTAPYMHDGSQQTLEEVVEWYAKGGHPNPNLSDKIKKLELTAQEKQDLVEFMKALTGDFPKVETARLPE